MKKFLVLSLFVGLGLVLLGCPKKPLTLPTPVKAELAEILVFRGEVAVGEMGLGGGKMSEVEIKGVGGTVTLSVWGKDTKGKAIPINPTWSTNQPGSISITPTVGPKVEVKGLKATIGLPAELYVEQEGIKRTITVYVW